MLEWFLCNVNIIVKISKLKKLKVLQYFPFFFFNVLRFDWCWFNASSAFSRCKGCFYKHWCRETPLSKGKSWFCCTCWCCSNWRWSSRRKRQRRWFWSGHLLGWIIFLIDFWWATHTSIGFVRFSTLFTTSPWFSFARAVGIVTICLFIRIMD